MYLGVFAQNGPRTSLSDCFTSPSTPPPRFNVRPNCQTRAEHRSSVGRFAAFCGALIDAEAARTPRADLAGTSGERAGAEAAGEVVVHHAALSTAVRNRVIPAPWVDWNHRARVMRCPMG